MTTELCKQILIVEDEGLIAMDLKERLERSGYRVTGIAADANEAIESIERESPDLILMDIRLKGAEDGITLAWRIRAQYGLPVIFVTAHAEADTLERAKLAEPFGYMVKPVSGGNFRAQIEMAWRKHAMEKKLRASEALLSATFRNVADALITTDARGRIVLMNALAEKLTGWTAAEAAGNTLPGVFTAFDAETGLPMDQPPQTIDDSTASTSNTLTLQLFDRLGVARLVEAEISTNRDGTRLLGLIIIFRDVTERRLAEKRAHDLVKSNAIESLTDGIARELSELQQRLAEAVTSEMTGPEAKGLGKFDDGICQQQALAIKLEELGKTDRPPAGVIDVNRMISGMGEDFSWILGQSHSLNLLLEAGVPPILANEAGLRENLLLLAEEVRDGFPDEGVVDVATSTLDTMVGQWLQISVGDPRRPMRGSVGEGVSRSGLQPPESRSSERPLAVVRKFVIWYGGTAEVKLSGDGGRVMTFVLTFPSAAAVSGSKVPRLQEPEASSR